jgi:hypothetical protein
MSRWYLASPNLFRTPANRRRAFLDGHRPFARGGFQVTEHARVKDELQHAEYQKRHNHRPVTPPMTTVARGR